MPLENMCRICLTDQNDRKMISIFDNPELLRKIEEVGGIELKPHAEFPSMLCLQCVKMLETSYKFKSLCQESNHAYMDFIIRTELKSEPQDVDFIEEPNEAASSNDSRSDGEIFFAEFIDAREVDNLTEITEEFEKIQDDFGEFGVDGADQTIEYLVSDDDESIQSILNEEIKKKKRLKVKAKPKVKKEKLPVFDVNRKKTTKRSNKFIDSAPPESIMCEICGNIYSRRSLLNLHMRRHLSDKPFECEICGKAFPCSSEIRRHMRTHTGEKPYICKYCGRTFADRSTNIKHERIHTNERPFACNTCGKTFTYSNVLKNHMLTHTGEKPFSCAACNKTFSRKHQLDQHCSTIIHQQTVKALSKGNIVTIPVDGRDNINMANVPEYLNATDN